MPFDAALIPSAHHHPQTRRVGAGWALAAILLTISSAGAAPTMEARLIAAAIAADHETLRHLAPSYGLNALTAALADKRRALKMAAITSAPLIRRSFDLLPSLVALLRDPDRGVAAAAAGAALKVAEQLRRSQLSAFEEPVDDYRAPIQMLAAVARDKALSIDLRVAATRVLAQLRDRVSVDRPTRLALLSAKSAALRRAAVSLFVPVEARSFSRLARIIATDPNPTVSRAAAVALCSAREPAGAIATLRKEPLALKRLRGVVKVAAGGLLPADELIELARCYRELSKGKSLRDQRLYRRIRRRRAVRRALRIGL